MYQASDDEFAMFEGYVETSGTILPSTLHIVFHFYSQFNYCIAFHFPVTEQITGD